VFRKTDLQRLRQLYPHLTIQQAAQAAGMTIRKPREAEYPFQFDNLLTAVTGLQQDAQWHKAAHVLDYMAEQYGNHDWMQTLRANALYRAGHLEEALTLVQQLNQQRPTVARLLIEARCHKQNHQFQQALHLYQQAESILDGWRGSDADRFVENYIQQDISDQGWV
jgi:tetratricopeptide (TPR) repeat protein